METVFMTIQQGYYLCGNVFAAFVVMSCIGWVILNVVGDLNDIIAMIAAIVLTIFGALAWLIGFLTWIGISVGLMFGQVTLSGWPWTLFYGGGLIMTIALIWSLTCDHPRIKYRYWHLTQFGIIPGQGIDETVIWVGLFVGAVGWLMITVPQYTSLTPPF